MTSKSLLTASAVILFHLSSVWAVEPTARFVPIDCELLLQTRLASLAKAKVMTEYLNEGSALPQNNLAARKRSVGENQVIMLSDVGTTIWDRSDLQKWYGLDALGILVDQDAAFRQMERIRIDPSFCPEGIDKSLCKLLRISLDARESASDQTYSEDETYNENMPYLSRDYFTNLDLSHERMNAIQFPWGNDIRYPGQMAPHHALQIFKIFARETLLKRLVFRTLAGKNELVGNAVDLETRLVLATSPQLLAVLPVLPYMPLETEDMRVGAQTDSFMIWYKPFTLRNERIALVATVPVIDSRSGEVDISFSTDDDVSIEAFRALEEALKSWGAERAAEFTQLSGIKAPKLVVVQNAMPGFDVQLKDASPQLRVLFIYFMKSRPLPAEFISLPH